ncbi:response regulator [Streptomyces sp. SID486]|uniref:LytR/AlgR family response regulator transcription factor n=1 Tax=unclassified Streptomyces TaxID=2593676 RepID=UPI0013682B6E|nr:MULTISPECIES: LytTR family DNA-binding domain-containing protein [unclassified Streptomyces]MYW18486.1 response regulator [Streptomyces sp. SID2955]MYW43123.1 response regulator [Streptomyces sp. SID161]MYX93401.1 response regulator [Streptomyces sp. SID486]
MRVNDVPLRVLAVDDERPALDELLHLLGEDPRVGTAVAALEPTEALRRLGGAGARGPDGAEGFDAVFLDTDMPGLSGLELARLLGGFAAPPLIVFVTAHEDLAVHAFDLKAVDYLLKPLRKERFAEAVRRVAELVRAGQGPRPAASAPAVGDQVPVELGGITRFVPLSDITHVEAQGDYARLHTGRGSHLVRIPLSTLEEQWRSRGFVRIHRSRLVALGRIEELRVDSGNLTVRIGDRVLAVSRRNAREVRDLLAGRAR